LIVQQAGATAGLAAVLGLGVLVVLYVAQARDVRRLREWAGTAPERAQRAVPVTPSRRPHPRIGRRPVAVALAGVLVLGGAEAGLRGCGADEHQGQARVDGGSKGSNPSRGGVATVRPGDVTVAVLNGTTVPGLAAALRDRAAAAGFRGGIVDDYSDKQLAASVVQYAPGHQAEAQNVGRRFGIGRSEPLTAGTRALTGDATVVVIAGADQAR